MGLLQQQLDVTQQILAEVRRWGELHTQHQQWRRVELTRLLSDAVVTRRTRPEAPKKKSRS